MRKTRSWRFAGDAKPTEPQEGTAAAILRERRLALSEAVKQAPPVRSLTESRESKLARGVPRHLVDRPAKRPAVNGVTFTLAEVRKLAGRYCTPRERQVVLAVLERMADDKLDR
jgi:hypothetical protein